MEHFHRHFLAELAIVSLVIASVCESSISGIYTDNGLHQTAIVKRFKTEEKEEMQHELLSILGLQHRPKPNGKAKSAPKFMLNLYKTLKLIGDDNGAEDKLINMDVKGLMNEAIDASEIKAIDGADMIMSFVNQAEHKRHVRHEKDRRFFFDFSEVSPMETLTSAELRIYKENTTDIHPRKYVIHVYMLQTGDDLQDRVLIPSSIQTVGSHDVGWQFVNVTAAADVWQRNPLINVGLYMNIMDEKGNEVRPSSIGIISARGPEEKQPFLVAFFKATDTKVHLRKRRSAMSRTNHDVTYNDAPNNWAVSKPYKRKEKYYNHRTCQRRTLYVNFKDLGWKDWIIAPEGYPAFYCHGECSFPLNSHMNATNHAIVQTLVHLMKPHRVPQPCCAPTKLSAISVLYFDDNSNVILKKYRNMEVKSCGCH